MNRSIPFNKKTLEKSAFQLWHYEPRQFIINERISLAPYVTSDFQVEPFDDSLNRDALSMFFLENGMLMIQGRVDYIGPGTNSEINIVDLSNFADKSIFDNFSYGGGVNTLTLFRPGTPSLINNSWWAVALTFFNITADPAAITAFANIEGTSEMQTGDSLYIGLTYQPWDKNQ